MNRSRIFAIALASAMAVFSYVPASIAFSEVTEETRKVTEIQIALKEFGFYKGRVDGKINKKLYAAMIKYSELIRSKGWSAAAGEITDVEIKFLLKQYEKRIAAKADGSSVSVSKTQNTEISIGQGNPASPTSGGAAVAAGGEESAAQGAVSVQGGETSYAGGGRPSASDGVGSDGVGSVNR